MKIEPLWSFVILTGFLLVWIGLLFAMSSLGWKRFADAYLAVERPEGRSFTSYMTSFGRYAHYKRAVRVIPASSGIYISIRWPFRLFHSPFLLPWSCIDRIMWPDREGVGGVTLHIDSPEGRITIDFYADAESELRLHLKRDARSSDRNQE